MYTSSDKTQFSHQTATTRQVPCHSQAPADSSSPHSGVKEVKEQLTKLSVASERLNQTQVSPLDSHSVAEAPPPPPPQVQAKGLWKKEITQKHLNDCLGLWREWQEIEARRDWESFLGKEVKIPGSTATFTPVGHLGRNSVCFHVKWEGIPQTAFLKIARRMDSGRSADQMARAKDDAEREIKNYSHIKHPNIVEPWAVGHIRNIPFILMDKAEGDAFDLITERHYEQSKPRTVGFNLTMAVHLVRAVHHLHKLGLLHRDIKNQNLLLGKDGIWRLCDLASTAKEGDLSDQLHGSPPYLAPECHFIARDWAKEEDHTKQSDIWSVGMALLETTLPDLVDADGLAWKDDDGCEHSHESLQEFYNQYDVKLVGGKTLGEWTRQLTGRYNGFLWGNSLPPAFNPLSEAPWNVQLAIVALATIRPEPTNRVSIEFIHQWLEEADQKTITQP